MFFYFFSGAIIGFLIALPIGPIDMLCIRKTLMHGPRVGFITGLGAACADALYGAAASFGVMTMITPLFEYKLIFQLISGLFLCCLGIGMCLKQRKKMESNRVAASSLPLAFVTTFFLALLSPATILSLIGAFTLLDLTGIKGEDHVPVMLTLGVFTGSSLWWLILNNGVALFRNKFQLKKLHLVNQFCGLILVGFGLTTLGLAAWQWKQLSIG